MLEYLNNQSNKWCFNYNLYVDECELQLFYFDKIDVRPWKTLIPYKTLTCKKVSLYL